MYRGYIKMDESYKLVAIKTGKGDYAAINRFCSMTHFLPL